MLRNRALAFCLFLTFSIYAQEQTRKLTLEEIFGSGKLQPKSISGIRSMKDGIHYTAQSQGNAGEFFIVKHSYRNGNPVDTLFKSGWFAGDLSGRDISGYSLSEDEQKLILITNEHSIYRRSSYADHLIINLRSRKLIKLTESGKEQLAVFSPDGMKVGFVKDHNIFYLNLLTGSEIQVTHDGKKNEVINGAADWVYEEEFEFTQAFYWSPDGNRLAFYRFDERNVPEYSMTKYSGLYPEEYKYKYPKAGEPNSVVSIHIYDLQKNQSVKADLGLAPDDYVPRIKWTRSSDRLCVMRLDRLQQNLKLILVESATGANKGVIYSETAENGYININDDLTFLKDGKHFLFTSEKDGYNHIYFRSMDGKTERQITKGEWVVTAFAGIDESSGTLYYESAETSPMERNIFSIRPDGSKKTAIAPEKGTNKAVFSSGFKYFINTWSDANTPPVITLRNSKGKVIRILEENRVLRDLLKGYELSSREFFTFRTSAVAGKTMLNGYMIKPPGMDSAKKHAVFMFVYGGPGSQTVVNSWDARHYLWHQLLAQKGFIVVAVDNRGTGARGTAFEKCTYRNLGDLETRDQVAAAQYLGSLPFVDAGRIGIFGWSYGGYLSSMCILLGNDVFKAAVAVAPVTDWRFYDSIYTERYMQTPEKNKEGYIKSAPLQYAGRLKGKFLLIHGTADDNVHYQQSLELTRALIKEGKQFEMFSYPDKNHSITGGNTRLHIYTKITEFLIANL